MQIPATTTNPTTPGVILYQGANPAAAKKTLGQEDFMKLLSAQLGAQDPMNPMKDTEFIAQMSSFSALENSRQLNATLEKLASSQSLSSAGTLVGRNVTVTDPVAGSVTGKVESAMMQEGVAKVVISGVPYATSLISRISNTL